MDSKEYNNIFRNPLGSSNKDLVRVDEITKKELKDLKKQNGFKSIGDTISMLVLMNKKKKKKEKVKQKIIREIEF